MNRRPPNPGPLFEVLDANHDGVLDANEIANAGAVLKELAKNNNGQLTPRQLAPPRGNWGGGGDRSGRPHGPPDGGTHRPPPGANHAPEQNE